MKSRSKNRFIQVSLIAGVGLMLTGRMTAQTFTVLHSFSATHTNSLGYYTNSDGAFPFGLISSGTTLYGALNGGGSGGSGTIFNMNTNGTSFATLYNFTAIEGMNAYNYTNSDGWGPHGVILSGNTLYGVTGNGGSGGSGTIFKMNTNGTGFATLYSFTEPGIDYYAPYTPYTNSDGCAPNAVILSGNTLYGTAMYGGTNGCGTVFKVNTNGSGFTTLYNFTTTSTNGQRPICLLCLSGNTLYGTTVFGGSGNVSWGGGNTGNGTIFKINTDGSGYTTLYSFTSPVFTGNSNLYTNIDGGGPLNGVVLSGNAIYGAASEGGAGCSGTIFKMNTNGTGFATLHSFTAIEPNSQGYYTINSDGWEPNGVILSGSTLYGSASFGSPYDCGTVFAVNIDGAGFTVLHSFTATVGSNATNSDGFYPMPEMVLWGKTLYGVASGGGKSGNGTIYSILLPGPPQLSLIKSGTKVILSWPTNNVGFTLQSTTNLSTAAWTNVSSTPVVVKTNNAVTNALSGTQMFFRLSQ
jgi:uncharacterized repeat protein (TIGR03803 family)